MSNTRWTRRVLGAGLVAGALLIGPVANAGAAFAPKFQVTVTDDFSSGMINFVVAPVPDTVEPVVVKVGFANNSIGPHVLIAIGGLPEDVTEAQVLAALRAFDATGVVPPGVFEAGAVFSKPGQDHQKKFDLTEEGQYAYFCPIRTPAGVPHYELGFLGLFDVTAP